MKNTLLLVDIQNDFCPGGALPVPEGDRIVPAINRLMHLQFFPKVVATKDWHPPDHISFASRYRKELYTTMDTPYGPQILWPDHCVQGTWGAEFHPALETGLIRQVVYKGTNQDIDSYSTFYDNARIQQTGLHAYLQDAGITDLYLAGLATDYCVLFSALDALELGYKVTVIEDCCRGVEVRPGDSRKALEQVVAAGGQVTSSQDFFDVRKEGR
jgi:nicotinamidase/pyrazinamidase